MPKTFHLITFFLFTLLTQAQTPKIGLALSGGGAKGMAHIGALRALEEAGIRPDHISGTSMGAVVGAMYAMGYTVDEIEEYLLSVDWEALLQNDIPRQRLSYLDRRDKERYLLSLSLTPNGITLPRAINYGHYMNKQLAHLTQKAHGKTDFSQFPIPFLCVATDLETGEEIIIERGDLADALRASVSFPSVFSPFEFEGRLCVDGGVRNNLPISILKEKGMDYVIAIDLQAKLYSRDRLTSLVKVLEQVGSFQNALNFSEQVKDADILVQPPTDEFGITSYEYSKRLIDLGYEYTVLTIDTQQVVVLDSLVPRSIYPVLGTPRDEVRIMAIQVEGNKRYSRSYIEGRLRVKPEEFYTLEHIEKGLDRLFGTLAFNYVKYRLLPVNGGYRLKLEVEEKDEYGLLQFGLHYDDDFKMAVLANVTFSNLLLPSDRLSLDLAVGEFPRADLSYIFEQGFWPALGLEFSARRNPAILYEAQRPISEIRIEDLSANVFLHSTIRNIYTLGAGIKLQDFSLSERLPIPDFEPRNVSYINYYGFLDFDSFDRTFKPKRGFSLFAEGRLVAQHEKLQVFREPSLIFQLHFNKVFRIAHAWTLLTGFSGASTVGPELDYPYQIFFGGLGTRYPNFSFPFAGYRYGEIFGRNGGFVRTDLNYEFASNNFISAFYNLGGMESTIDGLFNTERILDGYGISYGYNSPLGPVELSVMSSTNHSRFYTYINLGFWF